jgi:hypothetical protein
MLNLRKLQFFPTPMSCRSCPGFVALIVFSTASIVCGLQSPPESYTVGTPWVGPVGVRERTSDIMAREAREAQKGKKPPRVHRVGRIEFDLVEHAESDLPATALVGPSGPVPATSQNAQGVGFSFLGATFSDCHAYPPDSMGTVGPAQFIVAVNGRVRSFDKFTGVADGVLDANSDVFFAAVMTPPVTYPYNFTSDPRIRYDRLSGRWFIVMIDVPGNGDPTSNGSLPNRIMIAVSDSNIITPASVWTFYYFRHDQVLPAGDSNEFADYPTLGVDASALYIGVNIFATRGRGSFDNTTAFVVRKSTLINSNNAPTNIVVTAFRGLVPNGNNAGPYTPQGVDNYDPAATEGYIIGAGASHTFLYFDRLILRRISDPGGTPSISGNITISIPTTGGTVGVPALGTTMGTLDGLDYRLMAAHFRNGRLWTSSNLAVDSSGAPNGTDTRMGVRWYELQGIPTGQTPSFAQSGTLFDSTANARCYWMGTVMVSGQGHAAMGFSVAGANDRINAGTAGRLKNDPTNVMRTPILYTATGASYDPTNSKGAFINRWGDYSYTSLDPDDDMTMWTIQEFCNSDNSYGVQIAKLLAPLPATPITCSPSIITQGVVNASVTLTGTSDGDTGFFDPGAGFSNRIAAAVGGGGVTVNSVTYNNPTNLTLHVSVAGGATTGARNVTVTNPDGQNATSVSGILTIAAGITTNHPPSLPVISTKTVNELETLTFTNSASDPDGNALTYSLQNAPTNSSIGATNGVFSWTPTEAQGPGSNYISVIVTDNGAPSLTATQSFAAIVNEVNSAPTLAGIADRTIHAGSIVMFTNIASDLDVPANAITFSLDSGAPFNASINPTNGVFEWVTVDADANTTRAITVRATDDGVPPMDAAETFHVTVISRPTITTIIISNGVATVTWSAATGQIYRLQYLTNLSDTNWSNVPPDVTAVGPTATANDTAEEAGKYYRVMVVP